MRKLAAGRAGPENLATGAGRSVVVNRLAETVEAGRRYVAGGSWVAR